MKRLPYFLFPIALALLIFSLAACHREPTAQEKAVKKFIVSAIQYIKDHGKTAAFAEFSERNGSFVQGDMYLFVYDFNGNCLANGEYPNMVGQNLMNYQDKEGTFFLRVLLDKAKKGGGWVHYYWTQPSTHKDVLKRVYVMPYDDYLIASGYYIPSEDD